MVLLDACLAAFCTGVSFPPDTLVWKLIEPFEDGDSDVRVLASTSDLRERRSVRREDESPI